MEERDQEFIRNLDSACKTHDEWLALVRYGLGTLLTNQALLVEIIWIEAGREVARNGFKAAETYKTAARIFGELGLKLTTGGE